MKRILLYVCISICINGIYTQFVGEIKTDSANLWGEGRGNMLKKADSEALSVLINPISTTVESNFTLLRKEIKANDFSETLQSVIRIYSAIRYTPSDGKKLLLAAWLPMKINTVFSELKVQIVKIDDRQNFRTAELANFCVLNHLSKILI